MKGISSSGVYLRITVPQGQSPSFIYTDSFITVNTNPRLKPETGVSDQKY